MTDKNTQPVIDDLLEQAFATDESTLTPQTAEDKQTINIFEQLNPERQSQAQALAQKIDPNNPEAIVSYGTQAQKQINAFSHQMISQVKSKDLGEIGDNLRDLMSKIENSDPGELNPDTHSKWLRWLKKQRASFFELNAKYQEVGYQIDHISKALTIQKNGLLNDNQQLETLYQKNYDYFEALNVFIAAAQLKLKTIREEELPKAYRTLETSSDQMAVQSVNDLEQFTNRLEKRIYDLQLSRQVTIQQAPQIRLIQNTNQNLAEKIQSSLNTAIPLWKNQVAIQLSLYRQKDALEAQSAVTETTNQLLRQNADMLEQSTIETAKQSERGVVDIETLQHTQESLMRTIKETLAIQQEGRMKRAEAEQLMAQMEADLKDQLRKQNPS